MNIKALALGSMLLGSTLSALPARAAEGAAVTSLEAAPTGQVTLEQAVAVALKNSNEQLRAQLQAESALQDKVLARAAVLPRLDFNASLGRARDGGGTVLGVFTDPTSGATVTQIAPVRIYGQYSAGLNLRWTVFDGGKWWNNLDAADLNIAASSATVDEQKLQTRFTVESAFYALIRAQRQLAVLAESGQRSRDQADFTQKLFEGGRATQAEVYAARANRDNDEVNRLGAEARVEVARFDLALAMAVDPSAPLSAIEPAGLLADPLVAPPVKELVGRALEQRPSLKAVGLQAEAQRKSIQAAKGDYLPSVSLNGGYNRSSQTLSDLAARPDEKGLLSASIGLNWNLFQGFATDATVAKASLQLRQLENDLANGRRGVTSDVQKAWANLSSARAQARVAAQSEDTAREGLRLAKARQQVGVGTQLEVRDAELKLTQAQLSRLNALIDGRVQEAALKRATGEAGTG